MRLTCAPATASPHPPPPAPRRTGPPRSRRARSRRRAAAPSSPHLSPPPLSPRPARRSCATVRLVASVQQLPDAFARRCPVVALQRLEEALVRGARGAEEVAR